MEMRLRGMEVVRVAAHDLSAAESRDDTLPRRRASRAATGEHPGVYYRMHDPGAPEIVDRSKITPVVPPGGFVVDIQTTKDGTVTMNAG